MRYKRFREGAITPTKADAGSAGYDLYANIDAITRIKHGETVVINTGIGVEIPEGYFGAIFARSGLATKEGLRPANAVGVIDPSYRGEIRVALHNDSTEDAWISPSQRIAQLVLIPYSDVGEWEEVEELSKTERGEGGFGHSGKQ